MTNMAISSQSTGMEQDQPFHVDAEVEDEYPLNDSSNLLLQFTAENSCNLEPTPMKANYHAASIAKMLHCFSPATYRYVFNEVQSTAKREITALSPMPAETSTGINSSEGQFDHVDLTVVDSSQLSRQPDRAVSQQLLTWPCNYGNDHQRFGTTHHGNRLLGMRPDPYSRLNSFRASRNSFLNTSFLQRSISPQTMVSPQTGMLPDPMSGNPSPQSAMSEIQLHRPEQPPFNPILPQMQSTLPSISSLLCQTQYGNSNIVFGAGGQPFLVPVVFPVLPVQTALPFEGNESPRHQISDKKAIGEVGSCGRLVVHPPSRTPLEDIKLNCMTESTGYHCPTVKNVPDEKPATSNSSKDTPVDKNMSMKLLEEAAFTILHNECSKTKKKRRVKTQTPKPRNPFLCRMCGQSFTRKFSRDAHERIHTGERPYRCKECGLDFRQSGTLAIHTRAIHKKLKPHVCPYCKKTFAHLSGLKTHVRIHTKEKPYHCEICDKRFSDPGTFSKHRRVHTDERPYQCTLCNRTFSQSANASRHARNVHKIELRLLEALDHCVDENLGEDDTAHDVCPNQARQYTQVAAHPDKGNLELLGAAVDEKRPSSSTIAVHAKANDLKAALKP